MQLRQTEYNTGKDLEPAGARQAFDLCERMRGRPKRCQLSGGGISMGRYDFDRVIERKGTGCLKWDSGLKRKGLFSKLFAKH